MGPQAPLCPPQELDEKPARRAGFQLVYIYIYIYVSVCVVVCVYVSILLNVISAPTSFMSF